MYILKDVFSEGHQVWRQDFTFSKGTLLIFIFLNKKLFSKLVNYHVSFLNVNTWNVLEP